MIFALKNRNKSRVEQNEMGRHEETPYRIGLSYQISEIVPIPRSNISGTAMTPISFLANILVASPAG
jgi:hypothetical protein